MTRKLLLSVLALFLCHSLFAGKVTEQEALQKAQQFMQGKSFQKKNLRRAPQNTEADGAFYIFNAEDNGGFVIVSADDRTEAILAYADRGSFNTTAMPENIRVWLKSYAEQINTLGSAEINHVPRRADKAAVAPLVTSQWNQGSPYNVWCPEDGEDRSVTGCVATAMAQVMYYHKWPQDATASIPAYTTRTREFALDALPATVFKWEKMKDIYSYNETGEAVEAMAELMRYCGQAVEMDYTSSGSGANVSAYTMTHYFGYSKTAKDVSRRNYTTLDWENMIYNEIAHSRPVLYDGFNASGGHEFVIDGYDGKGLFHVNWGWGGSCDGYFLLSILNPDGRGIGGGSSSDGYSMGQDAVIGLQPDHGEEAALPMVYCYINQYDNNEFTRTSADEDFVDVPIWAWLYQWDDDQLILDHSWGLYLNGEQIKMLDIKHDIEITGDGYGSDVSTMVSFGAGLSDGTYEIRSKVCKPGTEEWENSYLWTPTLVVVISGNTATLMFADELPDVIHINSVTMEGAKKVGRDMTVLVNMTNNGFDHEIPLYLWVDGVDDTVAEGSAYLDNGQTGNLTLTFLPDFTGDITVSLSTDYERENIVWSESVTIEESLPQKLSGNVAIAGERNYTIEDTTIKATFTFRNEGEYAYDDDVVISLVPIDDDGDWNYDGEITEVRSLQLAVGEETTLNAAFSDLVEGQQYSLMLKYYSYYPEYNYVYQDWAAYTYCTVGTVLVAYDLDIDMQVKNADANNNIEGTTIVADITIKNNGEHDYNDKIGLEAWYDGNDGYFWWAKDQTIAVQVPAGQTVTIEDYEITDLTIGRSYCFNVSYKSENEPQYKWDWKYYTLTEPTAIRDAETITNKVIGIYTLNGQRIDTYRKGVNIVKMADGRTQKVVVK